MKKTIIDFSILGVVKVVAVLVSLYLLFLIRDIIALFFVVLILVATFSPVVNGWGKKIGRTWATVALLAIFAAAIASVGFLVVPPLISQVSQFSENLPAIVERVSYLAEYVPSLEDSLRAFSSGSVDLTRGFLSLSAGVFGGLISFLTAIVLFVYMLVDERAYKDFVYTIIPKDYREQIVKILRKVAGKVGDWFRGQLILAGIIFVLDLIALLIIGVPYALTLALISGISTIIPTIGPLVSGILAALVALTISPLHALAVILAYIGIQQLDGAFITPKVMQRAVGLSPAVVILAILIGAKLLGVVGALLAVPVTASISVLVDEWPKIVKIFKKAENGA